MKKIENIISKETISKIFNIYKNSTNTVTQHGETVDRFVVGTISPKNGPANQNGGCVLMCRFAKEELLFLWEEIQHHFPEKKLINAKNHPGHAFRMLRYGKNCFLDEHIDADCKYGVIIQLSETDEYRGGELCLNNNPILLNPGDAAILECYKEYHEVKPVTHGVRYSIVTYFE